MNDVAIVDFGLCNLDSIVRAVEQCGGRAKVATEYSQLNGVNSIILPGVGTFGDAMRNLSERGLDQALNEQVISKKSHSWGSVLVCSYSPSGAPSKAITMA